MDGMMNVGTAITAFVGGCIWMYKMLQPTLEQAKHAKQSTEQPEPDPSPIRAEEQPHELDFVQLSMLIARMNQKKNRLQVVEEALTSAQLGSMGNAQKFRLSWGSIAKDKDNRESTDYTIALDDAAQHQYIVGLAQQERAKLRSSLTADVDLLCSLRRYGVTETVTLTEDFSESPRGEE